MELINTLKSQGKETLANVIEQNGALSILEYSKKLWNYSTNIQLEEELKEAFRIEFRRIGIDESLWNEIINSLDKYRTIQTAPHTGLIDSTSVPALTLHSVALAGIPPDAWYVVGTFSGIPFGNDSYPGALSWNKDTDFKYVINENSEYYSLFKKRQADRMRDVKEEKFNRLALYSNTDRDDLVYRSKIPETFTNIYPYLTNPVKDYTKYNSGETDFTKVMVNTTTKFSQEFFNNNKIIYLDINEVISNYLTLVLKNKDHFIYKMFFDESTHKKVMDIWSKDAHFFYDLIDSQNGKKQVHAYIDNMLLKNTKDEEDITPLVLIDKLKNTRFCPGVFIGFTVLSFLNGFQCFGSFKQISYLTDYKKTWLESSLLPVDIKNVKTDSLTTGSLPNEESRYVTAIDIVLGKNWKFDPNLTLNEILLPMQDRLLGFKL